MSQASTDARKAFSKNAGSSTDQKVSVAGMKEIEAANDAMFTKAQAIQNKEMLIGWMNILAGSNGVENADVEDTSHKGILGVVISGVGDGPVSILSANTEGINKSLMASISGTKLGDWVTGAKRKQGLNVIVRTGDPTANTTNFQVKSSTRERMESAGVWGSIVSPAVQKDAIYFAYGIDSKTGTAYTDNDMWAAFDQKWQANAGRWFLDNVKSQWAVMSELGSKTIPTVTG